MFSGIGAPEVIIVLVIALLVLGPKRLPEVGKSIGSGMKEFKDSMSGMMSDDDDDEDVVELRAQRDHKAAGSSADKPADAEPADAQPADAQPAEAKPETEAKPAEAKAETTSSPS